MRKDDRSIGQKNLESSKKCVSQQTFPWPLNFANIKMAWTSH